MNSQSHYHTMTDEQLAEWHQLTTRVQLLTRDLAAARAATEAVQEHARTAEQSHRACLTDAAIHLAQASRRASVLSDAVIRSTQQTGQVLTALKNLLAAFTSAAVLRHQGGWGSEVFLVIAEAEEVLKAIDYPF